MPRTKTDGSKSRADEETVLRAITDSVRDRGYPPTQREIATACGWASPSGANSLIKLMEARGLIQVTPGIPRGLRLTDAGTERVSASVMVADTYTV